ncbi:uncharacterized protein METZ01_LOCUS284884, partial [marine metagenome]
MDHLRIVGELLEISLLDAKKLGVNTDHQIRRENHRQKPNQQNSKRHQKRPKTKPLRRPATLIWRIGHGETLRSEQALASGKARLFANPMLA